MVKCCTIKRHSGSISRKFNFLLAYVSRFLSTSCMTKQVNVEMMDTEAKRIRKDAIEMGVTMNEYARQAFSSFLSKNIAQRRLAFEEVKKKVLGRRIKA